MMAFFKRYKVHQYYSFYYLSSDPFSLTGDHDSAMTWEFWSCDICMFMHWTIMLLAHKD